MRNWVGDKIKNNIYNNLDSILLNIEAEKIEREVIISNRKFIQYPSVFPVDRFEDTTFFSNAIKVLPNELFLEIGVGSGVTSVLMATKGAKVFGVDINTKAILNAKANAILNQVDNNTSFFFSDVFSNISEIKFDTIYWNVPFCYSEINELTIFEKSVFDYQYKSIENFIKNVKKFIKPNGRILIGFSNFWGLPDKLFEMFNNEGYSDVKILEQKMVDWNSMKFDLTLYEI